jgi:hypothetical protein
LSTWALAAALAGLLALMQVALWGAARGLGLRLGRHAMAAGLVLPWLLLAPWLGPERLLVPTAALRLQIPGVEQSGAEPDAHELLNDAVFQFIPWELEVRHALAAGRLPLWSDRLGGGSSPWVNPQAGALSPIAFLTRALPIQYFLLLALALKLLVAAEGGWLLARVLGAGRWAAVVAGASFAWGGGIVAWGLFPHSRAAAWVPWVAVGAIRLARRPTPGRIVSTALLTAALLLAGHPETALLGGLFAAVCAVGLRRRRLPAWRGLGSAGLAALLGCGCAAPQLVPFLAAVGGSHRAAEAAARTLPPPEATVAGDPASWFLEGRGGYLAAPLSRRAFGRPYHDPFRGPISWPDADAAYAGILALAGTLAAFAALRRRRALLPVLGFIAGGLVLASQPLPLMRLLYRLPALKVPTWDRLLPIVALALAVAGAVGLESLARRRRGWGGWLGLAVATVLGVAFFPGLAVALLWAGAWAAVLLAVLARRGGGARRGWRQALLAGAGVLAAAVLGADLLPWARDQLPVGWPGLFYPPNAVTARARAEVALGGPWRVVGEDFLVYPGILPVYGLADPRPHDPMAPMAQIRALGAAFDFAPTLVDYFAPFHHPERPFADFLGVRVVISNRYQPAHPSLELLEGVEAEPYRLWRNARALPPWFLATGADAVAPAELAGWIRSLEDPRRVALLASEAGSWRPAAGAEGEVKPLDLSPGRALLALPPAAAAGDRLLATSLPSPAGWRATAAAGQPLRRLTVDGAFFGAVVPPGVERLELRFTPPGFWTGWTLWALAAALLAALALQSRRARR